MSENGQERTEQPTAKRRAEAHAEGRVPRSAELSTATVLLASTVLLATAGGQSLAGFATQTLRESARALSAGPWGAMGGISLVQGVALKLMLALLPFMLGLMAIVTAVSVFQARGVLSWKPLSPKWSHLSPLSGIKRLVGLDGIINLLKAILKIALLGLVTWLVLRASWPELVSLSDTGADATAMVMSALTVKLAFMIGLAFLVVAAIDYVVQVKRHEKSLKMSRQEVVQESRDADGDPMTKARIRAMARANARKRMLQAVPKADVVVVNPVHIAVALRYDTTVAAAPIVVAMGERLIAERIKEIAAKANVPIVENIPVARALLATGVVNRSIPPALYAAVAEILAFVYRRRHQSRLA